MKKILSLIVITSIFITTVFSMPAAVFAAEQFGDFDLTAKLCHCEWSSSDGCYMVPHNEQLDSFTGIVEYDQYFDFRVDEEDLTIEMTPLVTREELYAVIGDDVYGFGYFIGLDHHMVGVDVLSSFIELEERHDAFIGCESGGVVDDPGDTQGTNFFVWPWREIDETVSYVDDKGDSKSIRIITHAAPEGKVFLGDFVLSTEFGRISEDNEHFYNEQQFPDDGIDLAEAFKIDFDNANGIITIVPLCTKQEFDEKTDGQYGSNLGVEIYFNSFTGISLYGYLNQITGVNIVKGQGGGGGGWDCTGIGIRLWTENDVTLTYVSEETGESKTITIITDALPEMEMFNDDFAVDYAYAKLSNNSGVDETSLFDDDYSLDAYFDVDVDFENAIVTVTPLCTKEEFESVSSGAFDLWSSQLIVIRFTSFEGVDLCDQVAGIKGNNYCFVSGPSGGGPDWFETRAGVMLWTENYETIEYEADGIAKAITIITHAIPAGTETINNDFLFDHAYAKWYSDSHTSVDEDSFFNEDISLDDYFSVEMDYENATATVTPLYTKEMFESITEGDYGSWDDLLIVLRYDSFREVELGTQVKNIRTYNPNFVLAPSGGGPGWFETNIGIALWTENDETIEYTVDRIGKQIRIITHAEPLGGGGNHYTIEGFGDFDLTFKYVHIESDQTGYSVPHDEQLNTYAGIPGMKKLFSVSFDSEVPTIEITPLLTREEAFDVLKPADYSFGFFIGLDHHMVGVDVLSSFMELEDRHDAFGGCESGGVVEEPGDVQGTNFFIVPWYEIDETVSYVDDNGEDKSVRIITHAVPDNTAFLGDFLTSTEYGRISEDNEFFIDCQYELPNNCSDLDDAFRIWFHKESGDILIIPLCTEQEFQRKTEGAYGTDLAVEIMFSSFRGVFVQNYLGQLNGNFVAGHTGGDPGWTYSGIGVRLWTDNDISFTYELEKTGEQKTIHFITYADPLFEIVGNKGDPVVDISNVESNDAELAEIVIEGIRNYGTLGMNMDMVQRTAEETLCVADIIAEFMTLHEVESLETVELKTYLDIKLLQVSRNDNEVTIVIDILPKFHLEGFYEDGSEESLCTQKFTISEPVEMAINVGGIFDQKSVVSVHHRKDDGTEYDYDGEIGEDGYLRFTNPNGFSPYAFDENPFFAYSTFAITVSSEVHDYQPVEGTATAATCTESGKEEDLRCSNCGDVIEGAVIPALGHDYNDCVTAPTCTTGGYTTHTCSRCGDVYNDTYTDAFGHDWDEGEITKEPTCTEDGVKTCNCIRCGETRTEVIKALGHNYVVSVTEATCTQGGYTSHSCTVCGDSFTDEYTEPRGHKPAVSVRENETEASCEEEGGYDIVVYCSTCNEEMQRDHQTIPALGHKWDEGCITMQPTCLRSGEITYTCTVCAAANTEILPSLEHDFVETIVEPTCTQQGYSVYTCSTCGSSYINNYTAELNHDYRPIEGSEKAPTCTEPGKTADCECSICGNVMEGTEIEALGHDYEFDHMEWADDYSEAVAYYVCMNNTEHRDQIRKVADKWNSGFGETTYLVAIEIDGELVYFDKVIQEKTGWSYEDGEWYYYKGDGSKLTNGWAKDSTGWMWMDSDGRITKSKWIKDNSEWYYLKSNGYMAANEWTKDSTGWMYMDSNGKITKNKWIKDNGEWYYLKSNGYMAANEWTKDSSGWMYMGSNGKITKNKWIKDNGEWYYLKSNGYMAANEWTKDSVGWMYMDSRGKITKSKWIKYNGDWYYLKADGYMATEKININSVEYTFESSGRLVA